MSIAEQIAYIRNPKSNDVKAAALFVADAYEEAVATMRQVAQERQDALREFVEAAQERDRIKAEVKSARELAKQFNENWDETAKERDRLKTELEQEKARQEAAK